MFYALSKILPLFVYPIGFACLALWIGFILAWRRSRWTPLPIALALVVLLLASNAKVSDALMRSLEWQYLPPEPVPEADAIVLLGGSTERALPPRPSVDLREEADRILHAAELYLAGKAPVLLVSGGNGDRLPPPEAENVMALLVRLGVPLEAIVLEPRSVNTYENARFSKEILERLGSKQVLVVTSAVHMPRSMAIFRKQGIEAIAAPTDYQSTEAPGPPPVYARITTWLPDAQNLAHTSRALREYIGLVIYRLRGWA
ncbi:MAG: YdcF family protein [Cyanobacteria bacterium J06641_5]